ncbi:MAG: type I DNA topoisomerase [Eubacteriales bacterium]|jgi:DNA topoisomerase-1
MSKLVIVESPAKAKTIERYLGKDFTVMASMGHLRDLPKSQFGVDVEHDFAPKYISIRGKGDLIAKLKKESKKSDMVYLATDPDREGEAISWHLSQLLGLPENQYKRVTFNEITKTAVTSGIKHPRAIDQDLVDAQQARRILDRIVGYKLSPMLWARVKKGLSAGRVQSVTTKLIVDREREINAFIPKEYWNIDVKYQAEGVRRPFAAKFFGTEQGRMELGDQAAAQQVLDAIAGKPHVVSKVKKGEKRRRPAPPFITSTLQQEASRKLNFQSRKTMSVAQELYEGVSLGRAGQVGLITYMRTDSLRLSAEAQAFAKDYILETYGQEFYPKTPNQYRTKSGAQDAHEAIRPTSAKFTPDKVKEHLSKDQYRLYKLIWDRFIASQMEAAVYNTQTVDVACNGYLFKANGQTVKFKGFTAVYEEGVDAAGEELQSNMPELTEGQTLLLKELTHEQKFTQPPARYTEATLIKALEEDGIGRPSTYAPTITTILSRGYVVREKKQLIPTMLGEVTTDLLSQNFAYIVDTEFTAKMESDLDSIEEGKKNWVDVLREFYGGFQHMLEEAEKNLGDLHIKIPDEESDVICENCGRKMVYKLSKYGKFLACPGFPECRNTKAITVPTGVACPKCGGMILERKSKTGKKYFGCEHNPTCDFMTWDQPMQEKCPKCGHMLLQRTKWKRDIYCPAEGCGYTREAPRKNQEEKKEE